MRKLYFSAISFIAFLSPFLSPAQVTITYPSDRIIFQRDNSNQASFTIAGYVTECRDQIEARLVPIKSNPSGPALGIASPIDGGWQLLSNGPVCENFQGQITASGGWYRLEVRTIKNGIPAGETSIGHVGVGEIFLVAGQSNATGGDSNPTGPGAVEDAVSSVNFQNVPIQPYNNLNLPCPEYVHLDQFTKTAPFGNYAWCWGTFGDKLVQKLGVPVMIFNAGWSSTGVWNWKESIDFTSGTPTVSAFGYNFPQGLPFGHVRKALNNYIAQLGIRAVLWHQGESDNLVNRTRSDYYSDLKSVITATRDLSGKPNLGWVVSRATRFNVEGQTRTWPDVINAQNDIVGLNNPADQIHHAFPGPETDAYYTPEFRSDEVHFAGDGLTFLAQLWVDKIDNSFLANSQPYPALTLPSISTTKPSISTITMSASSGWSLYDWLTPGDCNGSLSNSQEYTTSPGSYRLRATDGFNNVVYSPMLFTSNISLPVTLTYFRANRAETAGSVDISWATSSETNASYFQVMRSTDGLTYSVVATLDAKGTSVVESKYQTIDTELPPGTYYYRLKEVDLDGTEFLSQIRAVKLDEKIAVNLYPNPVQDVLHISSDNTIFKMEIYSETGSKISTSASTENSAHLDFSKYQPGLYTIKINDKSYKIVKSR